MLCECFYRQPLEGLLYKYTNVVKGWQYRWFVLNPDVGRLEYHEVCLIDTLDFVKMKYI